jgi:hypothetical protein
MESQGQHEVGRRRRHAGGAGNPMTTLVDDDSSGDPGRSAGMTVNRSIRRPSSRCADSSLQLAGQEIPTVRANIPHEEESYGRKIWTSVLGHIRAMVTSP